MGSRASSRKLSLHLGSRKPGPRATICHSPLLGSANILHLKETRKRALLFVKAFGCTSYTCRPPREFCQNDPGRSIRGLLKDLHHPPPRFINPSPRLVRKSSLLEGNTSPLPQRTGCLFYELIQGQHSWNLRQGNTFPGPGREFTWGSESRTVSGQ